MSTPPSRQGEQRRTLRRFLEQPFEEAVGRRAQRGVDRGARGAIHRRARRADSPAWWCPRRRARDAPCARGAAGPRSGGCMPGRCAAGYASAPSRRLRSNHSRASVHSRLTVAADRPSAAAVSSIDSPPK